MKTISIIVPAYNEHANIRPMHEALSAVLAPLADRYTAEIIFVNDGSSDHTASEVEKLAAEDPRVRLLDFSRNFGKEIATTAGLQNCTGDAAIMIDADLQHPPKLIPEFIAKWEEGFDVVVGIRKKSKSDTWIKVAGSKLFYRILDRITDTKITPNATDFRLLDRAVIDEFSRFTEINRMTRGLIDWLGFRRAYIPFHADERLNGTASYNVWKLFKLAFNSFVSLSLFPLKLAGYLGLFITLVSGISGFSILIGKYFFHSHFANTFSDAENLAIFIVFLVGILLISIGLLSIYIGNIHEEIIGRPLYIIRKKR